jgi:protease I
MDMKLNGLQVAILVSDGFEQIEFTEPMKALEQEGAIVKVISNKHGKVQGFHHDETADEFEVDLTFDEAESDDFDAIVLPGGARNASRIRHISAAQRIVQDAQQKGKPIAVICHGPWLLVSSGLVTGRTMTSWPTLQEDIRNAGGNWCDQEVVIDKNWVSSRKPDDLPAFNQKMIEVMKNYMREHTQGTPDQDAVGIASS